MTPGPDVPPMSGVNVAVNLLWCVPGEVGGSEQYLARQLSGLAAQASEFVPTLHCLASFAPAHPELDRLFPIVTAPISGRDRTRRILAEHTWLARRTGSADLVHHGGGTVPRIGTRPIVLTIHDLQYATFPDYVSATKLRYLKVAMPRSVRRADVIAVPTGYVRSTVIDRFGVEPERVMVVPHGVEPSFGARARSDRDLRHEFGLGDGRVLVFPAMTHPHKGHRFLLEVMARSWPDPDLRLVLIGGAGAAEPDVAETIAALGLGDRVVRPGRVTDDDRDGLIRLADALVFPSEYEGFGAPVVEAMALETPVICSDHPALVEVVGDAAIVLPHEHEAWADALDRLGQQATAMGVAGRRRAARFTAVESGSALAAAYRQAVA